MKGGNASGMNREFDYLVLEQIHALTKRGLTEGQLLPAACIPYCHLD